MVKLGTEPRYRVEKGWSGKKYLVQMTQAEIDAREKIGLAISITIGTPIMILIMALAAGMIA